MNSVVALVGRALLSAIFIETGLGWLVSPMAYMGVMSHYGLPLPWVAYGVGLIIELVGGFAVLVGFHTRIAAAILAAYCIATAFIAHVDLSSATQTAMFMKNLAMAGGFLQLVAWGGGRYVVRGR